MPARRSPAAPAPAARPRSAIERWAGVVIVAATVLAYANTFRVPFLMDDDSSVLKNPSIRDLGNVGAVFSPPAGATTQGRPLLNLSFALNYAAGGESVGSYHVVNLLIHAAGALLLLGVVRRTLASERRSDATRATAGPVAFVAALCWAVHPVQTEAVTYISQRAESLMGLLYLLTLYAFIRGTGPGTAPRGWFAVAVAACAAGMAVKETMVTAPVLVLLYDRVFVGGTFAEAWRRRRWLHGGLAATWLVLAALMANAPFAARGVGATAEITPWVYALTEFKVVARYLGLALWPHPLVFDYGLALYVREFSAALPWVLLVGALLAATAYAWRRSPPVAFLGCAFFLLLAPTSTVVPVTWQPMAESRLYLPLAAVLSGLALACGRLGARRLLAVGGVAGLVLLGLTLRRNADYATEQRLWEDNLAKQPGNWRAHYSLALLYVNLPGRLDDALAQFEETVKLHPQHFEARSNLAGLLLDRPGRLPEAIAQAEAALRLKPDHAYAHANLGLALLRVPGREGEALAHLEEAVRLDPEDAEARFTLANALFPIPARLPEALRHFEAAVQLAPGRAELHNGYAGALFRSGRTADARRALEAALAIDPSYADARANLERLKSAPP